MGEETTRLRQEIDQTRQDLTRDVDELADKTSPSRIVERRVQRTRRGLSRGVNGLRERVMGSASEGNGGSWVRSGQEATGRAADSARESVSHVGERAQDLTHQATSGVREQAEGNPLAAGLIAFGAGWLVSSLMPASQPETQAAQRAGELAREHGGPVLEQAKQAAQDVGQELQGSAQEAAAQVRERAADAAGSVREEAQSSVSG